VHGLGAGGIVVDHDDLQVFRHRPIPLRHGTIVP
jgi:hypothetical protein